MGKRDDFIELVKKLSEADDIKLTKQQVEAFNEALENAGLSQYAIKSSTNLVDDVAGGALKGNKKFFKVSYNGVESPVYRGGSDFTIKINEVKINPQTGNVKTSHGVSLDVNPETISRFGGAYRIETIPEGLNIIQRGARAEHFEIVPAYEMPLEVFQDLLNQITITGPY